MVEQTKTVTFSDVNREHTFNTSQESGSSYLDSNEQNVPTSVDQIYNQSDSIRKPEPIVSSPQVLNENVPLEQYTDEYGTEIQDSSLVPTVTIKPEPPSDKLKDQLPHMGQEEGVVSALKEFEPPNTEGMSKARIRWLAAFNKIVSEMVEVSIFTLLLRSNQNIRT